MAGAASRVDTARRIRSERTRILQEFAQSVEQSDLGVLELVAYGTLEIVVVNNHIKHVRVIESVEAPKTLIPGTVQATA